MHGEKKSDMGITEEKRIKINRMKRRRRHRIYAILALIGCLALLSSVLYLGAVIMKRAGEAEATQEALADISAITYTQQELDAKIQEALQAQPGEEDGARKVLDGMKQSLENGVSVVETLREFYPENLVLASGGRYHFVPINDALKKKRI